MKNIFEIVQEVLLSADKYQSEDNNLLKAKVYSDIMMMDEELLSLLLSNERIKEEFFTKVKDTLVFDKQKFAWLIESKEFLPDSYTRYSNKIGLTSNGNFISQKNDVVLDFPYKDCYLQGGQDKEDQKREEIFYHETIASDEVTRMLAPKVFTNAKRYTKEGIEENIEFKDDDNLIIKGNNLIALSSLLKRYEGKVKLIYIDPPYNTGSDSFGYNDSFNHSTWLTFMKNRLDISKDLLSDNGLIFIQCDDNEEAYLKVLCDSIFGNDNFINIITIKTKIGGVSGSSEGKSLKDTTEFILVYAKNKQQIELNPVYVKTPLYDYIQEYKDSGKSWKYTSIITKLEGKKLIKSNGEYEIYSYDSFQSMSVLEYARKEGISEKEVYEQYADRIFRTTNAQSSIRQKVMDETSNVKNEIVSIEYVPIKGKNKDKKMEVLYKGSKRNMFMFLSDMVTSDNGTFSYLEKITTLWEDIQYNNLAKEGEVDFTNGKKPELILQRIIELSTNEDDIVLDYFAGSGTTAAVAHKMDRQYIGIEQMDYINDLTLTRLNKVLNGDSSGVSKIVNWQGGGSFVYCELLENSKELIDEIQNATDATITDIKEKIYRDERIVPYITRDELEAVDVEFEKLTLEEKKMALCALVDKNKLYVNLSDIDDETYNINDEDRKFTESFYKREV
ncbi:MAG: site-specific DNA-methyltransferase [Clostridium cochlearium]|uniref:site-specific DNA-methyltransferase n=1 Tax=Clostridium cochlearium TaxID=1494 RepID=UPI00280B47FA|nr:site-specific DNA-methyltransferase [Clostridium cochlearium]MDU1442063.1 site-specific DNA-methyltransferase [Clostridium cochlearium]